ncbi:MAG TPA: hypothetical protein VK057_09740 [Bacillota bacterium]|nr:hypothetical protein [Bacillota bacterium]
MMKKVFETSYSLVTEENGVVYVKARTRSIMVTALLLLIFGLSAYLLSQVPLTEDGGMEKFCFWAAIIILPSAGLLFIIGFLQSLSSTTVFDFNSGRMRKGSKVYDLSQIQRIALERRPFADREIFFLTAVVNGESIKLASETTQDPLEKVAGFLNQQLTNSAAATAVDVYLPAPSWVGRHFIGIFLITLGAIWSGTGYFFLQDLIFIASVNGHGPLVWPLGIWIAGLGLGDLAGIPVGRLFTRDSGRSKTGIFILLLYFATYLLLCWR